LEPFDEINRVPIEVRSKEARGLKNDFSLFSKVEPADAGLRGPLAPKKKKKAIRGTCFAHECDNGGLRAPQNGAPLEAASWGSGTGVFQRTSFR
jgi:hypothetical protein